VVSTSSELQVTRSHATHRLLKALLLDIDLQESQLADQLVPLAHRLAELETSNLAPIGFLQLQARSGEVDILGQRIFHEGATMTLGDAFGVDLRVDEGR